MTLSYFASESVCAGHPDKLCDQISDAILDAILAEDPRARVAVETLASANKLLLAGEVTTIAKVDFAAIAQEQVRRIGYTNPDWGFYDQCEVEVMIHEQSHEIAIGVDEDGAGDQGMMFGYACKETPELMPLPITLAHALTKALDDAHGSLPFLRPDGKAQVVVRYEQGAPAAVEHVTLAKPHDESIDLLDIKDALYREVVTPVLDKYGFSIDKKHVIVNGTGAWYVPGPYSDAGLTGRKIVVDGYGGFARVGGGAFSGKDPSKVDRSGAYAARYIAKNIVAAGLAERAEVALAYYIGAKEPVMLTVDTQGTSIASEAELLEFAKNLLTPSVKEIIEKLNLRRPLYLQTAAYGHFGKHGLPWEDVAK